MKFGYTAHVLLGAVDFCLQVDELILTASLCNMNDQDLSIAEMDTTRCQQKTRERSPPICHEGHENALWYISLSAWVMLFWMSSKVGQIGMNPRRMCT